MPATEDKEAAERVEQQHAESGQRRVDGESGYRSALAHQEAEADRNRELNETINRQREEHRLAWEETEVADTHRQQAESERIMRLPSPQANKELGLTPGDPTRGPAS